MEYTKTINIDEGDIIECLTEDGWETGKVVSVTPDTVTAFMDYIGEEREFEISLIRV